jgi:hypothetical protein
MMASAVVASRATELFDDGIEFDAGETGADALADVFVVETGPFGSGSPWRAQRKPRKPQCSGLVAPRAGQRRLKQRLHALIGGVGFGDQVPHVGTELVELAIGFLQERLGEAEATGPRFELDHHARGEGGADGLEGFDLLALGRMSVEKGAGDGVKRGGLAGLVGSGEDIQPGAKGPSRTVSRKRPTCVSSSEWRITRSPPGDSGKPSGEVGQTTRP